MFLVDIMLISLGPGWPGKHWCRPLGWANFMSDLFLYSRAFKVYFGSLGGAIRELVLSKSVASWGICCWFNLFNLTSNLMWLQQGNIVERSLPVACHPRLLFITRSAWRSLQMPLWLFLSRWCSWHMRCWSWCHHHCLRALRGRSWGIHAGLNRLSTCWVCATLCIQDGLRDAEDGTCEACQGGDYAVFALIATRMQDGLRRIVVSILHFPITPSNHHSTWRQARNNGQRHRKAKLTKQHFASIQGFRSAGCSDRVVHWFLGCSVQEQCSMGPRNRKRSSFDVRLRAFQLQYLVLKGNQDQLCWFMMLIDQVCG